MALFIKQNGSLVQVSVGHEISKPEQQKSVSLDLASGDQTVTPDNGQVLTQVLIKKPETLISGNIKKDVNIGGVVGSLESVDYLEKRINGNTDSYSYENNNVTKLRGYSFYYDANIISFSSSSVTTLGQRTFNRATNMTTFVGNNVTTLNSYNFTDCFELVNVSISSLQTCGMYEFNNCSKLETISLPNLTQFGTNMFSGCSKLKNVYAPLATFGTGNYVFNKCSSLVEIDLPSVSGSVSNNMFSDCSSLTTVNLGNASSLSTNVFYNCTSLTDVTLSKSDAICSLSNVNAFYSITPPVTIHVPSNLISSYQTATNWSTLYNNGDITFVAIQ